LLAKFLNGSADCAPTNAAIHHREFDMHKLTFGLATLVIVGGVGGARADSSDRGSNDSLKWEMREMQRMRQYSGVVPDSYPRFASSWNGCTKNHVGPKNGCRPSPWR
jgi:hypothetical protein